jgi:D-glycero-D-manno-heptose 1,7-bisphosphate phosphatase
LDIDNDINQSSEELKGEIGVFIDRDGTINEAGPGEYITKWVDFKFIPGALEGLSFLATLPVKIFIVTNQSGVYRGFLTAAELEHIHGMMEFEIVSAGGRIDGLKYCPHMPRDKCSCRKPSPMLFEELAREHAIDLTRSINIGDSVRDMEAGIKVGMKNILIRTGHGKIAESELVHQNIKVDYIVDNLKDASEIVAKIVNEENK